MRSSLVCSSAMWWRQHTDFIRLFYVCGGGVLGFSELTDIDGFGAGGIFLCRFTGTPTFGAFFGCFPSALACDDTFEVHKAAKIARTTKSLSSFML
uniref:Uncharacterized protein n=1 Tax=Triticum urartu TaxID=4572 RepID=A0A8R7QHP2_TRIUA